jgi:hypothetical protein
MKKPARCYWGKCDGITEVFDDDTPTTTGWTLIREKMNDWTILNYYCPNHQNEYIHNGGKVGRTITDFE